MDDYAGRVVGMASGEEDEGLRVAIAVVKVGPGGVPPQLYELLIDADGGSMAGRARAVLRRLSRARGLR
jgi:hypothetical protein